MENYDFIIEQDDGTYYFLHKEGAVFYYNSYTFLDIKHASLYDFNNFSFTHDPHHKLNKNWIKDLIPLDDTEYKIWLRRRLFRQELKEVLDE